MRAGDTVARLGGDEFAVLMPATNRFAAAAVARRVRDELARVTTPDGWWLLRASNTQAVLVARAEATDEVGLERLKSALIAELAASGVATPDFVAMAAGHWGLPAIGA